MSTGRVGRAPYPARRAPRFAAALARPYDRPPMRRALRWVNVLAAAAPLASGLAVLVSTVSDAGYREHYRDSVLVVLAYVALHGAVAVAFARDTRAVPALAVAKAVGAYVFLAMFVAIGPLWMARTPGRYVYLLFDWGPEGRIALMAYVLLGRGVWNTLNAMYFTAPWWITLRRRQPFLGRLVTIVPLAGTVALVAAFVELRDLDRRTYSAEAHEVARMVFDGLDCEQIRAKHGTETTDLRQRAEERFTVHIRWDCRALRINVQDARGRLGHYAGQRLECCAGAVS